MKYLPPSTLSCKIRTETVSSRSRLLLDYTYTVSSSKYRYKENNTGYRYSCVQQFFTNRKNNAMI